MSTTEGKTKIQFHPDAPRPRFLWQASLPTTWMFLNTHPEASARQSEIIAENFIPGHRFKRAEQKLIIRQLDSAISAARKAKALVTLVLPGVNEIGEPSAATLVLRWYDSSPDMSSMSTIKRAFEKKAALMEEANTPRGNAYAVVAETTKTGPLDNRRDAYHRQAFIPVAGTSWTLVASGTTPDPETDEKMKDVITRLANSIQAFPESYGETLPSLDVLDGLETDGQEASEATAQPREQATDGEDPVINFQASGDEGTIEADR